MLLRATPPMYLAGGAAMHLYDGVRVPWMSMRSWMRSWGLAPHLCVPLQDLLKDSQTNSSTVQSGSGERPNLSCAR
jgi:hypothetical protein